MADQVRPVASVRRPKIERNRWRILEPQEVPRVAAAFSDARARRVFLTLVLTGIRRFELQALRWRHVNLDRDGAGRRVVEVGGEGEADLAAADARRRADGAVHVDARTGRMTTTCSATRREARGSRTSGIGRSS